MTLGAGEVRVGAHRLRILKQRNGFAGIIVGRHKEQVTGTTALEVETRLRAMLAEEHPDFIGLDGARKRFLGLFPEGFTDPAYIGDSTTGERHYKSKAAETLQRDVPVAGTFDTPDIGLAALRVMQQTNLLDPFSKAKLADVLRGPRAAEFLSIARSFAMGDTNAACRDLSRQFKAEGVASWVCLTYFPFLWLPDRHMFLKPTFTKAFATRIGHSFAHDYESAPNPETYASLLHMTAEVGNGLGDLDPADNIDLHSFMWVVMDYRDTDVMRPPTGDGQA
ncbi:MAG: hypothetical protein U1E69_21685 [Tabrizicola sp.]|uniref:hypothetical protein n=1 Tax=Tabrizicola sp. TaxID=2005166 RepID=UPI002ABA5B5C|nr:hypothetical protein [Tabrizicola sp.]MDZ4089408.1 hypothetical protein [Tabrizicola sp.]